MVTRILRMESAPKPADAADALAIAICHLWQGAATSRLQQAASAERSRLKAVAP
jgi:crossover junction endodeoxyribonuclease RuvC